MYLAQHTYYVARGCTQGVYDKKHRENLCHARESENYGLDRKQLFLV